MSMNVDNNKSLLIDRIKESPYINLIPDYLRENEDFLVFFYLMAKEWDISTTYIDNFTDLINPDKVPKQFIENLGAYSNFTYNNKASVEFNREVLMRMFTVWKMRGTEHSIVMNAIHGDNPAYIGGDIFIPNYPISTDKASLIKPRDRIFILSKSKLSSRDVFEDAKEFREGVLELEVPYMSKQIKEKVYAVTQAGVKYIFITTTQFSPNIELSNRDIDEYGNLAFNMVVYPKTRAEKENYYGDHGMDLWLEIDMHINDPWRYDTLILSILSSGLPLLSGPAISIEDSVISDMGASMLPISYLCQPFDTDIKDNSKYIISNTGEYLDYKTKKGIQFINRDINSLDKNNNLVLENDIDYLKDLILSHNTLGNLSYQGKLSGYRNHEYSSFSSASDIETLDTLYSIDNIKDKQSNGYDSAENPLNTNKDTFSDTIGDIEITDTDTSYLKNINTYDSTDIKVLLRNINIDNPNTLDINIDHLDSIDNNKIYGYYNSDFADITDINNITDTNLKACITNNKSLSSLYNNQYYSTVYGNIDISCIFTYNNNTYVCLQGDSVTDINCLGIYDKDNNKAYTVYYIDNIYTMDISDNKTLKLKQSDNYSNKTRLFIFNNYALDKDIDSIENLHIEINPTEYKGNISTIDMPYTEHIKLSFKTKQIDHFFGYITPNYIENTLKTVSFGDFSFDKNNIQNTLKDSLICHKDYDNSHLSIQALYSFVNPYTDSTTNPAEYIYLSIKALDDMGIKSLKSITKIGLKSLDLTPNTEITNISVIDTNNYIELPYIDDNGNFSKYKPTENERLFLFKKADFLYSNNKFKDLLSNKVGDRVFLDTEGYISIKSVNQDDTKNHMNFVINLYYDNIKASTDINNRKDMSLNTNTDKLNNSITIPNNYTKLYVSSYGSNNIKKYSVVPVLSGYTYYLDKHKETYSDINYTVVSLYDNYSNYIAKTNPKNILIIDGYSDTYKNIVTIELGSLVENTDTYYSYDRSPSKYTEFDINTKY